MNTNIGIKIMYTSSALYTFAQKIMSSLKYSNFKSHNNNITYQPSSVFKYVLEL